jgi:hypothetical protein
LNEDPILASAGSRPRRDSIRLACSITLWALYSLILFVRPQSWPLARVTTWTDQLQRAIREMIEAACVLLGVGRVTFEIRWAIYFVLAAGVIPWVVLVLVRRGRPYALGFRLPNRIGWRIVVVGWLLAFPFQLWMIKGASFADYYRPQLERSGVPVFLAYYAVVILAEHFYFHGFLLATCRSGGRWPGSATVAPPAGGLHVRILRWIGLCQPVDGATGAARLTRWIGLQDHCILPILVSGLLFAAVHLGKDPRELALSLPGGIALGYVSYRTNTWLIPFLLHALNAGTACALMLLMA